MGACPLPPDQTKTSLRSLLRDFDRTPDKSRRLIRELLEQDVETFYAAAIEMLKDIDDSRAYRHVIAVLMGRDLLLRALCDRALTREQAAAVLRATLQIERMADYDLANALAARNSSAGADAARVMEIIAEVSKHARIPPALRLMMRHPDPHLRSKAVLMIGRENRNAAWLQNRLAEADPRIRANAVESLWGVDSADARDLLHAASQDSNNRVAGNAVLALYRLGEVSSISRIIAMAAHESPLFRASSAWVMGETGDPRFSEIVARMLGDASEMVRKRALMALQRLRTARGRETAEWRVAGWLDKDVGSMRRLRVVVGAQQGAQPTIVPTQVAVFEDGQLVPEYCFEQRRAAALLSVAFVFPEAEAAHSPFNEAARGLLPWKRPQDVWSAAPYLLKPSTEGARVSLRRSAIPIASGREEALTLIDEFTERIYFPDLWTAIAKALDFQNGPAGGERRLVVYNPLPGAAAPECEQIAAAAQGCRASVQAISLGPDPALEFLCAQTHGRFRLARSAAEVPALVLESYVGLLTRYAITYEPLAPAPAKIRIQVHSPSAAGAACLTIPWTNSPTPANPSPTAPASSPASP